MAYRWTKKRKEARNRLSGQAIFFVIALPFTDYFRPVMQPGPAHPIWQVIIGILIIFGFYSIANDIRTLIIDELP